MTWPQMRTNPSTPTSSEGRRPSRPSPQPPGQRTTGRRTGTPSWWSRIARVICDRSRAAPVRLRSVGGGPQPRRRIALHSPTPWRGWRTCEHLAAAAKLDSAVSSALSCLVPPVEGGTAAGSERFRPTAQHRRGSYAAGAMRYRMPQAVQPTANRSSSPACGRRSGHPRESLLLGCPSRSALAQSSP